MTALIVLPASVRADDTPDCPPAPPPVLTLGYDSRYVEDDSSRSEIDETANADVNNAQAPLDDFIRALADRANRVFTEDDPKKVADCVVAQVAEWARAGALTTLETDTTRLTLGSRLAGIALALRQVQPFGGSPEDWDAIKPWLATLTRAQMLFWEEKAPPGARRGNLRAWAALGAAAISDLFDDAVMRSWATWSASYVTCTANNDGSLPQEMSRGRLAYHYQLHAVAPLVVTARLLQDAGTDVLPSCDQALARVVAFTLGDLRTGAMTKDITGEPQRYFEGTEALSGYHLAWVEAWNSLAPDETLRQLSEEFQPLSSSKLGGDQRLLWRKSHKITETD